MKLVKNSSSFTNSRTQAHEVNKMNVCQYFCCPDWNQSAQAAPSGNGEGWDPLDGNMNCQNQRKCPLKKISAFLHPYKKYFKSVTVKLWKSHTHPTTPQSGFVCCFLLVSLLNKWKYRNQFLKLNRSLFSSYPYNLIPFFFFLLIKVKLFWFSNRRKREKLNQSHFFN